MEISSPPRLTALKIENFKSLQHIELQDLPPVVVLIGENGSGKSSVMEAVSHLFQVVNGTEHNAAFASRGLEKNFTKFEAFINNRFKINKNYPPLSFNFNLKGVEAIKNILQSPPYYSLEGAVAINGEKHILRMFASNFSIEKLKSSTDKNYDDELSQSGDNLPNIAYFLNKHHPLVFKEIVNTLKNYVEGLEGVIATENELRQVVLRFTNLKMNGLFFPKEMSDGLLIIFAYLILLRHPNPYSILTLDEPERHLYPRFLPILAEEIQSYAQRAGTVVLATHSPELVSRFPLNSIYLCKKNSENFTQIHRLSENNELSRLFKFEGYLVGDMMRDGIIDEAYK